MSTDRDKELIEAVAQPWICVEPKPCEETIAVHWEEMLTSVVATLAAVRRETWEAAIEQATLVVKGWHSDLDESWDERPDLSFEAADKIVGANEVIAALESAKENI